MLFLAYLSLALASAVLAAPQDGQRAQCPTTITQTSSFPVPTTITSCKNTISKCTATTSISPPPTTPCTKKTKTITTTTTIQKPKKTITSTVTADPITVTPSCPSPTTPATQLINVIGFQQNRCGNPAVAESGSRPNVQLVSLTIPQGGVIGATNPGDWATLSTPGSGEGSCGRFDSGQISSLIVQSLPSNLAFASTCRLFAFRNVGCDEGAGSVAIDLSRAQRGLCQDPELLSNINSVQIRC